MIAATGTRRSTRVGLAAAAIVVGVLAIPLTVIFPTLALLLGGVAFILGWVARRGTLASAQVFATIGMSLGLLALVATIAVVILTSGGSTGGAETIVVPPPT